MSESEKGASLKYRYFYTDPLAAAWMIYHFQMKFIDWGMPVNIMILCVNEVDNILEKYYPKALPIRIFSPRSMRVYVHPDSLHLLEPQAGDILQCKVYPGGCAMATDDRYIRDLNLSSASHKIIQRNGTDFMWPEGEAA